MREEQEDADGQSERTGESDAQHNSDTSSQAQVHKRKRFCELKPIECDCHEKASCKYLQTQVKSEVKTARQKRK
jgi:hypothetical protein